jgi:hypothetical protein
MKALGHILLVTAFHMSLQLVATIMIWKYGLDPYMGITFMIIGSMIKLWRDAHTNPSPGTATP